MQLMGVKIDEVTRAEARAALQKPQVIFTPNPEILLEAQKNKKFRTALKMGTLMLPDGHGLLLVSTLLKCKSRTLRFLFYFPAMLLFLVWKEPFKKVFPQIIHGSDFMVNVIEWAAKNKKTVFFLGAKEDVAKKTAEVFKRKFPSLRISGFSSANGEEAYEEVKQAKPEVLFVAYGAPKQELWIAGYAKKIPTLFHVMGVGGSFDFHSGTVKRAPGFIRTLGLEWVWRLLMNPLQRFVRIWNAVVVFPVYSLTKGGNLL